MASAKGDERVGRNDAADGMAPADQSFGAGHGFALQVERWLVEQEELVVVERFSKVDLKLEPIRAALCMLDSNTAQRFFPLRLASHSAKSASLKSSSAEVSVRARCRRWR
ncbi:MAG TPA: hypothetical protein VHW04_10620 [Solirubrobacteraceae bacterium]|nr:hypothetical protein [Solirubrobacteraceae bacterium]